MRLTSYGQAIAMERGNANNHSAEYFLKKVIESRIDNLKRKYSLKFTTEKAKGYLKIGKTDAQIINEIMAQEKKMLDNSLNYNIKKDFPAAEKLLEQLRC